MDQKEEEKQEEGEQEEGGDEEEIEGGQKQEQEQELEQEQEGQGEQWEEGGEEEALRWGQEMEEEEPPNRRRCSYNSLTQHIPHFCIKKETQHHSTPLLLHCRSPSAMMTVIIFAAQDIYNNTFRY